MKPRHLALLFIIAAVALVAVTETSATTPQPQPPQPSFAKSEEALQSLLLNEQQQPVDDEVLRGIAKEYNTEILCLIAKQYADLATKAHDAGNTARENTTPTAPSVTP